MVFINYVCLLPSNISILLISTVFLSFLSNLEQITQLLIRSSVILDRKFQQQINVMVSFYYEGLLVLYVFVTQRAYVPV